MCGSLYVAFHEELDLLESHYDAALFRSRHGALLAHHGLGDDGKPLPKEPNPAEE